MREADWLAPNEQIRDLEESRRHHDLRREVNVLSERHVGDEERNDGEEIEECFHGKVTPM
jgi:hypothetical protein